MSLPGGSVQCLFSLEYEAINWVFGLFKTVEYLDQLPTFRTIILKNFFNLIIEI